MRRIILTILPLLFLMLFTNCVNDKNWEKESLEVYTIKPGDKSYAKDKLSYLEINYYDETDKKVIKEFYHKDATLKGKEKFKYNDKGDIVESQYFDNDDRLLSTYKYEQNALGQTEKKFAYEGDSNTLLRIERFTYDLDGNRITKEILDQNAKVNRTYAFGFDDTGNEIFMAVMDSLNNEIFTENYSITRKDLDGTYIQAWGLIGKEPKTVRYRNVEKITKP